MNLPVENVDTSMPLLANNTLDLQCAESTLVLNSKGTGNVWKTVWKTMGDAPGVKDDQIVSKNFPIYHQVSMAETDRYDGDAIAKKVAMIAKSVGITGVAPIDLDKWHERVVDKIAMAKVVVKPSRTDEDGQTFEAKNEIRVFLKPTEA